MMRRIAVLSCMVFVLAAVPLVGASANAGVSPEDVVKLSPEEALAHDLTLLAEAKGWTDDKAAAQHHAQAQRQLGAALDQAVR